MPPFLDNLLHPICKKRQGESIHLHSQHRHTLGNTKDSSLHRAHVSLSRRVTFYLPQYFTLMPFEQLIYWYLGKKKKKGKKPKATLTAAFPLSASFVSGFSWKRCLSKQLLSCTAASLPGMHREHGSWWDQNNPCGLGCHGRHNGELCDGIVGAKHGSPLHNQPRT